MIGDRLRQSRLAAGLTLDQLRRALQEQGVMLTRAALSKYELNKSTPPAGTLMKLAKALDVPPSRFLQEPTTAVTWLAFRKHPRLPVRRHEQIKAYAHRIAEHQTWLETALDSVPLVAFPPPRAVGTADGAEQAALELRETWKLGGAPVESVAHTAETHGAIVIAWSRNGGLLDGLSAWVDGTRPLAVVNDTVSPDRRRFTLAHEFGHMLMTIEGDETGAAAERLAHRFAAAFLVPGPVALQELGRSRRHISLRELALLKQKYGLSMLGWIHRAHDLGIIDDGLYRSLYRTFVAQGWKKVEPEPYHGDEAPTRLEQMTARALAEGILSEARARQMCPRAATMLLPAGPEPAAMLYRDADLTGFEAFGPADLLNDAQEG